MRKMRWLQGACALAVALGGSSAFAADHLDGPKVKMDPATDITDIYTWVESDKLLLVLNVSPLATNESKFSDAVQYAFHVESSAGFGMAGQSKDIVCSFDADQMIDCMVGDPGAKVDDQVKGDASKADGLASDSGMLKVFAGLRADPFFFNLEGFNDAVATVKTAAPTLTFDGAGCPNVNAQTSMLLVGMLQGTNMGAAPAEDFFAMVNVLSIVLEVDKSLVTGGGSTLAVWGSTHAKGG